MAYDLEEQEQLDEFKAWWKRYGKMVTNVVLAALVAYAAFQGWKYYQSKQSLGASTEYQQLIISDPKDLKSIQSQAGAIMDKYPSTPYAGRAALFAAKTNYQANEVKSAKAQLNWTIEHAKESAVAAIASLQLANILVEEKDYEGALKLLDAKHDAGFDGLFADLKGDIMTAQGKTAEAKAAYAAALSKLDAEGKYRTLTQQKLDALG